MRKLSSVLLVLVLVGLLLLSASRVLRLESRWTILMAAFSPYALVGYAVVLVAVVLAISRAGARLLLVGAAVVALVGSVVHLWWLVPLFVEDDRSARPDLVVMTTNLDGGQGDPATVVRRAREGKVDLVVLEEVTARSLAEMERLGLSGLLRHRRGAASDTDQGIVVYSRFPLGQPRALPLSKGGLDLRVLAPHPFRLLAVHTSQPVKYASTWGEDLREVQVAAAAAVRAGDTIVVGDFNATRDNSQFREVLDLGLRDAAEQAGSGWQPTWPTRDWNVVLRPLIAIDHVLSSDAYVARRTWTAEPEDSDHLALVVDLGRVE